MTTPFALDCFDGVLAARMAPQEWSRISAFRNHPNFLAGLRRYHLVMPPFFSDNLKLNKVVTEAWRFEMLVYSLYLYDQMRPDDPRSGLTLANLKAICKRQNCASPGRVLAVLGIMWSAGFLKRSQVGGYGRAIQLAPSDGFIQIVEQWNANILGIIDAVAPEGRLAPLHAAHPRFGWEMRREGAERLLSGWKLLDPYPEVNHFVASDGGWMLLLHCVGMALLDGPQAGLAPVSVNLTEFGARFGVSRSHLRRLLESAHAQGLLTAAPKNGSTLRLSENLVASFLACMASELAFYRGMARKAIDSLGLVAA